ncbi:expressed unknown protein [Seminavis robusta]|uniref:Uncharacterized protein n=1 Tax=Seminavis robusta TaxID=568900 RepID=A0A9N8DYU4_9STRA|nr:expressed unknown protein [Seminavis robusta]|eukprot:Sro455_g146530.1 n/a (566) ;mRNA; f:31913-33610
MAPASSLHDRDYSHQMEGGISGGVSAESAVGSIGCHSPVGNSTGAFEDRPRAQPSPRDEDNPTVSACHGILPSWSRSVTTAVAVTTFVLLANILLLSATRTTTLNNTSSVLEKSHKRYLKAQEGRRLFPSNGNGYWQLNLAVGRVEKLIPIRRPKKDKTEQQPATNGKRKKDPLLLETTGNNNNNNKQSSGRCNIHTTCRSCVNSAGTSCVFVAGECFSDCSQGDDTGASCYYAALDPDEGNGNVVCDRYDADNAACTSQNNCPDCIHKLKSDKTPCQWYPEAFGGVGACFGGGTGPFGTGQITCGDNSEDNPTSTEAPSQTLPMEDTTGTSNCTVATEILRDELCGLFCDCSETCPATDNNIVLIPTATAMEALLSFDLEIATENGACQVVEYLGDDQTTSPDSLPIATTTKQMSMSSQVGVVIANFEMTCEADYEWTYSFFNGAGTMAWIVRDGFVTTTWQQQLENELEPSLSISQCDASVTVSDLELSGSVADSILNTFERLVSDMMENLVSEALCTEIASIAGNIDSLPCDHNATEEALESPMLDEAFGNNTYNSSIDNQH